MATRMLIATIFSASLLVTATLTSAPAMADHFGTGGGSCSYGGFTLNAGTLLGGALGGFAGSQIGGGSGRLAATALGVFLGSAIGTNAGSSCRAEAAPRYQPRYQEPVYQERRHVRRRRSPRYRDDSQYYYYQQPARISAPSSYIAPVVETRGEDLCREYTSEAVIGGELQPVFGTACLQDDGSWRVVSQKYR